jgi:hypothetical protein
VSGAGRRRRPVESLRRLRGEPTMETAGTILGSLTSIIILICFILVVIKMFQNSQTGLGIACIVLVFCVGIGFLVAFIVGWINARRWGITNIMIVWTVCFILNLVAIPLNPNLFQFQAR